MARNCMRGGCRVDDSDPRVMRESSNLNGRPELVFSFSHGYLLSSFLSPKVGIAGLKLMLLNDHKRGGI